ncbi:hypothetical protein [Halorussus salinisoli]|uniref:hypothetical protein n=1 Tax=Halorussus salinisoli TaxID=2558242 RepID=UPI002A90BA04|nr:hypothetical protein [Halorussus salinisoli]
MSDVQKPQITNARGLLKSEVFKRPHERGLEDLWKDVVLAQHRDDKLDREEAIKRVDRTKVERTNQEQEIVEGDVDRGLNVRHGQGMLPRQDLVLESCTGS